VTTLPLAGVRVVDQCAGAGSVCGRFLADLGADVVLVEPPNGSATRSTEPTIDGVSLAFVARNTNKRGVTIDLETDRGRADMLDLLDAADIWITTPSTSVKFSYEAVRVRFPHLVIAVISDFGLTGPRKDWAATDWTLLALAGQLSQSGVPDRPPFMPPGDLAEETSSVQAAWAVMLAYWNRLETGHGDLLDISRHEATAQIIDPAFGSGGTAIAQSGGRANTRVPGILYPIFPCADGHVRIVVLAHRQWLGLRAWLGEPEPFTEPRFDRAGNRYKFADQLYPLIADLFRNQTAAELVAEGQRRGVPIAPVLQPGEALEAEHFHVRGLFAEVSVGHGLVGHIPYGALLMDGERAGLRTQAPAMSDPRQAPDAPNDVALGHSTSRRAIADGPDSLTHYGHRPIHGPAETNAGIADVHFGHSATSGGIANGADAVAGGGANEPAAATRLAMSGIRVLDLGVIVMGGEAGRMFADQGADVIKVENRRFPDGARVAGMAPMFSAGQRNKRSFGVDLRSPDGVAIFERLVATADVVLSNFKPGTLDALGLGYERLNAINPGVVLATSSAMGESGPWSDWMGYGPLVRCVSGLASLWCDPEAESGFGDSTTVYPDHFAARIIVAGALAALIRRRETGVGAHVESSQAEAIMVALAPQFLRESLEPGSVRAVVRGEHDAPWGIYPCTGDDAWCVITVRTDAAWRALVDVLGHPKWATDPALTASAGRLAAVEMITEHLATWTTPQSPLDVANRLQAAGVAAAPMQSLVEQSTDPHLVARQFYRQFRQPGLEPDITAENGVCKAIHLADPPFRPAPYYGEHTREICRDLLDLTDPEIDALVTAGTLDEMSPADIALRSTHP
jgi:crotonobetainyl-CoA:carnitine CoA-transferase CaiB-like acyl-CoA transferase